MAVLMTDPKTLLEFINTHDQQKDCLNPKFAFMYGPMMAVYPELAKALDEFSTECVYFTPFKYVGYLRKMAKQTSPAEIKNYLKSMTIDLEALKNHYALQVIPYDVNFFNLLEKSLKGFVLKYISNVRESQKSSGITESCISNFAPLIPYSGVIKKQELNHQYVFDSVVPTTELDGIGFDKPSAEYDGAKELLELYKRQTSGNTDLAELMGELLLQNIHGIITYQKKFYSLHSAADAVQCAMNIEGTIPYGVALYYGFMYLMSLDDDGQYDNFTCAQLSELVYDLQNLSQVNRPLTDTQFAAVFEGLMKTETPQSIAQESTWFALSKEAQKTSQVITKGTPKLYSLADTFNLDALISTLYNMRYIEFTEFANQQLISGLKLSKLTDTNYLDGNMVLCEVNDRFLVVPYVDIADDYAVKCLSINRNGIITQHDCIKYFDDYAGENI